MYAYANARIILCFILAILEKQEDVGLDVGLMHFSAKARVSRIL